MNNFIIKILFLYFTALLFVNNSNALESYLQIPFLPNDTAYYCFITDAFTKGGENYVKVRKIQIFTGLNAIAEAKADGKADFIIDILSSDTSWFLRNEYYIADREKNEFKLIISDKVKINIYSYGVKKKISVEEFFYNSFYYKVELDDKYTNEKSGEIAYYPFEIVIENGNVNVIDQFKDW